MLGQMKKLLTLSLLLVSMLAFGCTADNKAPAGNADPAKDTVPATNIDPAAAAGEMHVHDVKCGCSIEGVGKCGNFIMIEGKYVPLIHSSLGKMEFCKQKAAGAKIETKGAMKDGKFVAESWKLVE